MTEDDIKELFMQNSVGIEQLSIPTLSYAPTLYFGHSKLYLPGYCPLGHMYARRRNYYRIVYVYENALLLSIIGVWTMFSKKMFV